MAEAARSALAERKRRLVADELRDAALMLLAKRGFATVTVDDIVAAAGMSRRTFFRYYASKEDVVVRFLADMGGIVVAALAERPATESPSAALRAAFWAPLVEACADDADHVERSRVVVRLILDTPALYTRWLERQNELRTDLAAELARRHGVSPAEDPYPRLAAGMALLAFDTVLDGWRPDDDERRLAELTDRAFAVIAPALDARH